MTRRRASFRPTVDTLSSRLLPSGGIEPLFIPIEVAEISIDLGLPEIPLMLPNSELDCATVTETIP